MHKYKCNLEQILVLLILFNLNWVRYSKSTTIAASIKPAHYSDDFEADLIRNNCDFSIRITENNAKQAPRPVRIYADGIYDLFHYGHARQLRQAKNLYKSQYLIVGVCNDSLTEAQKGPTVLTEFERYEIVRNIRYVDEVVRNAPWTIDQNFINFHKIDFVVHDDIPYSNDAEGSSDIYNWLKNEGKFIPTKRTDGVSTTEIIARILRNYRIFMKRNLERGFPAKDINLNWLDEVLMRWEKPWLFLLVIGLMGVIMGILIDRFFKYFVSRAMRTSLILRISGVFKAKKVKKPKN